MRMKSLLALALGLMTLGIATAGSASAFFWDRPDQPAGWDRMRTVRHWVYYPRYRHVYLRNSETDPHAYRYSPRGYYPYYNSNYWRPAGKTRRAHNVLPPYYAAWGGKKRNYHHVEWHNRHYGGHRRGDW
jgi:hypothetical protein